MGINWAAATWFAERQYSSNFDILHQKIDQETELLEQAAKLSNQCNLTQKNDFSAHRNVCELGQDSHVATQMRLSRFRQAEKALLSERHTNQTVMLGLLGLTTSALAAVFLFIQASCVAYRPRRLH
jgi:hypothetical protein